MYKSELPIEMFLTLSHPVTPYSIRRARRQRQTITAIATLFCALITACTIF